MKIKLTMTKDWFCYESEKVDFLDKYSKFGFLLCENDDFHIVDPDIFEGDILELLKEIKEECIVQRLDEDLWYVEIYNDHRE